MARTPWWHDELVNTAIASGAQGIRDVMGNLSQDETRGSTIVRVILDLDISASPTNGVIGTQMVDIGLGVVSEDAFAASAVPDPSTETDRPPRGWLFRTRCVIYDDIDRTIKGTVCKGDFRGKRRLDAGILALILNNEARDGNTFSVRMTGICRTLYLLP